jgi:hypothetical protein
MSSDDQTPTDPTTPRSRRRLVVAGGVVVVLALLVAFVIVPAVSGRDDEPGPRPPRPRKAARRLRPTPRLLRQARTHPSHHPSASTSRPPSWTG